MRSLIARCGASSAQKLELGLLDAGWSPEPLDEGIDFDSARNRDIARRMAESSIVLLENSTGLLPLQTPQRIAIVGPCADDAQTFFGCYAFPNHVIPMYPDFDGGIGIVADSLLSAMRLEFGSAEVDYAPGCPVSGGDLSGLDAAVDAAAAADVVVLGRGDRAGIFGAGTSGEGCDAEDLNLPGHQPELVEAILRDRATDRAAWWCREGRTHSGSIRAARSAIMQAFFPGEEGGSALAGCAIWSGQSLGQAAGGGSPPCGCPAPHVPGAAAGAGQPRVSSNLDPTPAFPFGHGLSYTSFGYENLRTSAVEIDTAGSVELTVIVCNTGARGGDEVVQLYASDPVATVTRPVTQLIGFARVRLDAGESAEVSLHCALRPFVVYRADPGTDR